MIKLMLAMLMLACWVQGCAVNVQPEDGPACEQGAYVTTCSDSSGAIGTKACQVNDKMSPCQCSDDCDAGIVRQCFAPDGSLLPRDEWPAFTGKADGCSFLVVDPVKCMRCH